MEISTIHHIVLFDGVCNLCNKSVQFIITHDKKKIFYFASLQSDFGQKKLQSIGIKDCQLQSIVYIQDQTAYFKSDAALHIAKSLGGKWKLLYYLHIIPKKFRDLIYSFIAKKRYKWFGKREECWLPTPELQERFL